MGNEQSKKPTTIQELTNACVRPRIPFTNASPPEKLWNHDPNDVDQVYPNIFVSGGAFAQNLEGIKKRKITHVLNTAQGKTYMHVDTDTDYYPKDVTFKGIQANDSYIYDLSKHFQECTEFIDEAVNSGGRVLVHCRQGFSRSPTIVAVYLMQKKGMTAKKALETIRSRRNIFPNEGFMKSLIALDTAMFHPELVKSEAAEVEISKSPEETESNEQQNNSGTQLLTASKQDEESPGENSNAVNSSSENVQIASEKD